MKRRPKAASKNRRRNRVAKFLERVHLNAAGIDIGSASHWVAVPEDRDDQPVREFKSFTPDLHALADWLGVCGVETIAMESTGVYWIPLFEILQERGLEVLLVNARHVKGVPGRKTDVTDCQWLQQLHTFGLLRGSFRPDAEITAIRCKATQEEFVASLTGHCRSELVFALRQSIELYDVYQEKLRACDEQIEALIGALEAQCPIPDRELSSRPRTKRPRKNESHFDIRSPLFSLSGGVDLTDVPGIGPYGALQLISEIGLDMSRWPSPGHFAS